MHWFARAVVTGLAALGFVCVAGAALIYVAREDIANAYKRLPVAVFAKCPGAK